MEMTTNKETIENLSPVQDSSDISDEDVSLDYINIQENAECYTKRNDVIESNIEGNESNSEPLTVVCGSEENTEKDKSGEVIALEVTETSSFSGISTPITSLDNSEVSKLPPISLPAPSSSYVNDISVFCITQQGESHVKNEAPCQDRSEFRWVNNQILMISIADGVGSCQLSDYGAETAVKSSLDYLEQHFGDATKNEDFVFDDPDKMKKALSGAMQYAYDSVEKRAEELEALSYSMQSTLTVTVYDGQTLYFSHAGDDGIVALNKDGVYAMVTERIKGEEANSVFPLQSKQWYYGKVNNVVGYVMATDGVLDAFVRPLSENNRVYYRFIEPVFYTSQTNSESAKTNCNDWNEYLKSSRYRNVVTDDITFVGVVNQVAIKKSQKPLFDDNEWNKQTKEYEKKRRDALYPPQILNSRQEKKKDDEVNEHDDISPAKEYSSGYIGNYSYPEVGSSENPNNKNKRYHDDNGHYSVGQAQSDFQGKPEFAKNIDMIVNGTKQTASELAGRTSTFLVTLLEVSGEVLAKAGETSGQLAVQIKRNLMDKNQQNSSDDSVKKRFSNNTDQ